MWGKNSNITLRWGSTLYNSDAFYLDQSCSNEEELMASCADEWFRVQPSTLFGDFNRSEYQINEQDFSRNKIEEDSLIVTIGTQKVIETKTKEDIPLSAQNQLDI